MVADTTRKEKFRQKRRLEIISAGSRVLSDKGLNGFTVKDVSESMGIGRGTLYEHIKTKNDILYLIMEDALRKSAQILQEEVAGVDHPIAKLFRAIQAHVRAIRQHSVVVLILYQDAFPLEKSQFQHIRELVDEYHRIIMDILEEGKETGCFAFDDTHLLAHSITAVLNTWLIKKNFLNRSIDFGKYTATVGRLIIQGLLDLESPNFDQNLRMLSDTLVVT